jgi:hypothetical protein
MAASVLSAIDMDTKNFGQNNTLIAISPKQSNRFQISNNGSNFSKLSKPSLLDELIRHGALHRCVGSS